MNSTIHADLHELKTRFETLRTNRKYGCEPILRCSSLGVESKGAFDFVTSGCSRHTIAEYLLKTGKADIDGVESRSEMIEDDGDYVEIEGVVCKID
jgi:hypothetical protein